MGIAPLDWADAMPWEAQMRILGTGTPAEQAQVRPRGLFDMAPMPGIAPHTLKMMTIVNEHSLLSGEMMRPGAGDGGAALNAAGSCIEWMRCGSQVFDFERDLSKELADTDVDDVQVSEIQLPYEAFYLRFGGGVLDGMDRPLDGLLVEHRPTDIPMLGITAFRRHGGKIVVDTMCVFPLEGNATVVEAIDKEVARTTDPRSGRSVVAGVEVSNALIVDSGLGRIGQGVEVGMAAMHDSTKRLRTVLPLVVNALLYIDGCRAHISRGWPQGAPDKLAAKAAKAIRGETRARDTLLRGNWREVHICTLEAEERSGGAVGTRLTAADRTAPRSHFRRAHWRRQPCGPANSLRRRVRIRAALIGRGPVRAGAPRKYDVQEKTA